MIAAHEPPRIGPSGRQALQVALAGYVVVALFGAAYGALALLWPELRATTNLIIAALLAAPTALGLVWPHLTGVKAFGLEVSLANASAARVEPHLVETVIRAVEASDPAALERAVRAALPDRMSVISDTEPSAVGFLDALRRAPDVLLTVDLGAGDAWWSTRLYLLAALAEDFLRVPQFVVLSRYPRDEYVGMATPTALRSALGLALPPAVDQAYAAARRQAAGRPPDDRFRPVAADFLYRIADIEPDPANAGAPGAPSVTGERLDAWLTAAGQRLNTEAIVTTGLSHAQLVQAVLGVIPERHIALVDARRKLETVVDRLDVLAQLVEPRERSLRRLTRAPHPPGT